MNKKITKYSILFGLALIFAAPGISAYIFYQHPHWLDGAKINKGTLLNPSIPINAWKGSNQWRLIFWNSGKCLQTCRQRLNQLAKLRLALGRSLYQVELWFFWENQEAKLNEKTRILLHESDFHILKISPKEALRFQAHALQQQFFIANPDGFLILSYEPTVRSKDIFQDLKILLKTAGT